MEQIAGLKKLETFSFARSKLTDDDLNIIAGITQLESLGMDKVALSEGRLPVVSGFAHLKSLTFALRPQGYPADVQAKVKALLPKVAVKFVPMMCCCNAAGRVACLDG